MGCGMSARFTLGNASPSDGSGLTVACSASRALAATCVEGLLIAGVVYLDNMQKRRAAGYRWGRGPLSEPVLPTAMRGRTTREHSRWTRMN